MCGILLEQQCPRATGPLVNLYRHGRSGVEVVLLELAAAIEDWTKLHRTLGRRWAQPSGSRRNNERLSHAIVKKAGPALHSFAGDSEHWSRIFWETNNSLEHALSYRYNVNDIRLLAVSAAVLMECVLLSRCSGSRAIAQTICEGHRNNDLGVEVKRLVANSPILKSHSVPQPQPEQCTKFDGPAGRQLVSARGGCCLCRRLVRESSRRRYRGLV